MSDPTDRLCEGFTMNHATRWSETIYLSYRGEDVLPARHRVTPLTDPGDTAARLQRIRSRGQVLTLWVKMTALFQGLNRSHIDGLFELVVGSYCRVSTLKSRHCTAIIEKDSEVGFIL